MKSIKKDKTFTVRISIQLLKEFDKAIKAYNSVNGFYPTNRNALIVSLIKNWLTSFRNNC